MKYSPEFLEANARLKTLDEETLNDELNKMTADELLAHGDYMIQQTLEEKDLLSEEEAQAHINELLQLTREPSEDERKPIKVHTHRTAKRILILAAAILILISVFMVAAVASKRDFSILNGVVKFEDGKVYVHFLKEDESLSIDELETDLREHGFDDIKLPGLLFEDKWKAKGIVYKNGKNAEQVNFEVLNEDEHYSFSITRFLDSLFSKKAAFFGAEDYETIWNGRTNVYLIDHGNGLFQLIYYTEFYEYRIQSINESNAIQELAQSIS